MFSKVRRCNIKIPWTRVLRCQNESVHTTPACNINTAKYHWSVACTKANFMNQTPKCAQSRRRVHFERDRAKRCLDRTNFLTKNQQCPRLLDCPYGFPWGGSPNGNGRRRRGEQDNGTKEGRIWTWIQVSCVCVTEMYFGVKTWRVDGMLAWLEVRGMRWSSRVMRMGSSEWRWWRVMRIFPTPLLYVVPAFPSWMVRVCFNASFWKE